MKLKIGNKMKEIDIEENDMATVIKVNTIPACDFCGSAASYDGKTIYGPWANMCDKCFKKYGVGLGMGRGQKLELNEKEVK